MTASQILAFRNEVQKALFDIELAGQISDGHWENATPHNHYVPWIHAVTIVDPNNVGRDFYAVRDRYGFSSPRLLEAVEGRMLAYARMTLKLGIVNAKLFSEVVDIDDATGAAKLYCYTDSPGSTFWRDRLARARDALQKLDITIEELEQICTDPYLFNHQQLVRELRDMSKICRIRRS